MDELLADLNIRYETNAPLGPLTWYGLGGPADVLAHPSNVQQLSALTARCRAKKVPVYVLGAGANLLVRDEGVRGVVVRLDDPFFSRVEIEDTRVVAGAGADLMKLVLETARQGLGGLEALAGIPATLGGAIRMNAGGAFGDIGRRVARVEVMDDNGQVYYRERDDLHFEYRKTNITARFILSAELELEKEDPDTLVRQVKEIFMYKKNTQPMGEHSPGCGWKNPKLEDLPPGAPPTAGAMIDQAGLKKFAIGGAYVSPVHANFIIARDGATARDVLAVFEHVEKTVQERFGVKLERELVVWP